MRAILFDFDYTLADSSEGILACFQAGLKGIGLPPADSDAIRRTIGLSLPDSLVQVAGEEYRAQAYEFRRHWRAMSQRVMVDRTKLYEPVPKMLRSLQGRGSRLGIVSTKWRRPIEEVLARHRLQEHFETIVGGDDVEDHKPSPEGLLQALSTMGAHSDEALYVGDSVIDGQTARRAGVKFVAVLTGATPRAALEEFDPVGVLEDVGEIPGWI